MSIAKIKRLGRDLLSILIIKQSGLFDRKYYLNRYPTAGKFSKFSILHYLRIGAKEGRDPSFDFNTSFYLSEYPEVRNSGMNPLVHYILHGKREGRIISPMTLTSAYHVGGDKTLLLDLDGGGTTVYTNSEILPNIENEETIFLSRYFSADRTVRVSAIQKDRLVAKGRYKCADDFLSEIAGLSFSKIIINNLVTWPSAAQILTFLSDYKQRNPKTKIEYKVHDHYSVCPSHTLMNVRNKYCGVRDDETECADCIRFGNTAHIYSDIDVSKGFSVSKWRKIWNDFFTQTADEIEVFSQSSKDIFLKAYPSAASKTHLNPHIIPALKNTRIAILGHLIEQKGSEVIRDFCSYLDENRIDDIQLYVFGKNVAQINSKHLKIIGPYQRAELPELLKKENIDIVFVPSVCPETFCYTAGEALSMGYPVCCFDLGGQADQVKSSENGIILYNEDPVYLYNTFKKIDSINLQSSDSFEEEHAPARTVLMQDHSARDFLKYLYSYRDDKSHFVPEAEDIIELKEGMPKIIAFYLPQFHDFPENLKWFGRGFSEWTNTSQTMPQFIGHNQPQIPIDVGYYNLNDTSVMHRQAELARKYGIAGFAVYYYWYSGDKLMEQPLQRLLKDETLDFPFFLFWANENWTRLWGNGANQEILHKIELLPGDARRFMDDALPYMKDSRYIRIHNKPVLIIYKLKAFPKKDYLNFVDDIQTIAKENGLDGIYVSGIIESWMDMDHLEDVQEEYHLDAITEFSSMAGRKNLEPYQQTFMDPACISQCYNVEEYVKNREYLIHTKANVFAGLFTNWDNSPRRYSRGATILQNSPEDYKKWLADLIKWTREHHSSEEQLIFVNAWNEWAESAHLEPDTRYGYAYLQKTREALEETTNNKIV